MLKIQFKDGRADPIPLIEPGKTVGRGDANDIVIDEDGVNGFHADLKVEGTQVTITDINSSTGTLVNGEKINGPMPLGVGDLIVIQGVELEIIEDDELVEITPKNIRLRKRYLTENERKVHARNQRAQD